MAKEQISQFQYNRFIIKQLEKETDLWILLFAILTDYDSDDINTKRGIFRTKYDQVKADLDSKYEIVN